MHVGEAVVATLEFVGETFVVDAEEVQHRGLEIVDVVPRPQDSRWR